MENITTLKSVFGENDSTITVPYLPSGNSIDNCALPRKPIITAVFSFLLVLILVTVIGNLLVGFVILTTPTLRKQSTFLFLASLAIADTLIGAITMPINATVEWHSQMFCMPETVCFIHLFMEPLLSVSSVMHLFVISIDRYISIKYVYEYNVWMTHRRVSYVILSIWVSTTLLCLSNLIKWQHNPLERWTYSYDSRKHVCTADNRTFYVILYAGCFLIPLLIMLYTYSYVYRTAIRHISEISRTEVRMIENSPGRSREQKLKERKFHTLRSIVIVFIIFFVCWFPSIVYILTIFYAKQFWTQFRKKQWFTVMHFTLIRLLPTLNSTTNPFIYVLANRQFRTVAKQLFWKLIGHKNRPFDYMQSLINSKISPSLSRHFNEERINVSSMMIVNKRNITLNTELCNQKLDDGHHTTRASSL